MNNAAKVALTAAAVALVAIVGFTVAWGNLGAPDLGDSPPSPSSSPSPSPSAIADPVPLPDMGTDLEAGLYTLAQGFPVQVTFELQNYGRPDLAASDWTSCGEGGVEQTICRFVDGDDGPVVDIAIGFLLVTNVVADPCDESVLLDPPVGPSVDDLVAAISDLPGFETTVGPEGNTAFGGYEGRALVTTAVYTAEDGDCGAAWATPSRVNGVGRGERNNMYILNVDGVRIVITVAYNEATISDEGVDRAEDVLETIRIEPIDTTP